jgi:FkbM family methyltransferase
MYREDVERFFDSYWSAHVDPGLILDFQEPQQFVLHGFDFPVWLSCFTEPVSELMRYVDHANVSDGAVVIDAGAYCGLTSLLLAAAGADVLAFEPDVVNSQQCFKNFETYRRLKGDAPQLYSFAIADRRFGLVDFCSEGAMGSNAVLNRGETSRIESINLSGIVARFGLPTVDYIKMDIEGSEVAALSDEQFFAEFHPRMSVEVHYEPAQVESLLRSYGYQWFCESQPGSPFQLYQCY